MKKLFLHIGFNKTGSSSIQRNLVKNSSALEQQGFLYPYDPKGRYIQGVQHAPLVSAVLGADLPWLGLNKRNKGEEAYSDLRRKIEESSFETLILSSEGFGNVGVEPKGIERFRDHFRDYSIQIIAYVRRQDDYLVSCYQQGVKAGRTRPFNFEGYRKERALYFGRRLAPWRSVFGSENVIVRPFDPRFWPERELFFDFMEIIGANREGISLNQPENEGLDFRAVEFLRQLNKRVPVENRRQYSGKTKKFRKLAFSYNERLSSEGGKQKLALSSEQAEILRQHFREDNLLTFESSEIEVDDFFAPVPPGRQASLIPENFTEEHVKRLIVKLRSNRLLRLTGLRSLENMN